MYFGGYFTGRGAKVSEGGVYFQLNIATQSACQACCCDERRSREAANPIVVYSACVAERTQTHSKNGVSSKRSKSAGKRTHTLLKMFPTCGVHGKTGGKGGRIEIGVVRPAATEKHWICVRKRRYLSLNG